MAGIDRLGAAAWLLAATAATLAGCGSNDPVVTEHPYPDVTAFCEGVAQAICNDTVVEACYESSQATLDSDGDTCIETYAAPARCNPKGLGYDKETAIGCVDAYRRAYKDGKLNVAELEAIATNCEPTLHGSGVLDDSCTDNSDCDGSAGLRCVVKAATGGSCQQQVTVSAGNDCADKNTVCEPGYYCGSDHACIVRPAVGEACNASKPCLEDALCDGTSCIAKSDNGVACSADDQCLGGICSLVKGTGNGKCGTQVTLSPTAGDTCTPLLP